MEAKEKKFHMDHTGYATTIGSTVVPIANESINENIYNYLLMEVAVINC